MRESIASESSISKADTSHGFDMRPRSLDLWVRCARVAAWGGLAALLIVLLRHWHTPDPLLGANVLAGLVLGASWGAILCWLGSSLRAATSRWRTPLIVVTTALVATLLCWLAGAFPLEPGVVHVAEARASAGPGAADLLAEPGDQAIVQSDSALWLTPALRWMAMAGCVAAYLASVGVRESDRVGRKFRVYATGVAAVVAARCVASLFAVHSLWPGLARWSWLGMLGWLVVLDAVFTTAAARRLRAWQWRIGVVAAIGLVLAVSVSWRPIAAEAWFTAGWLRSSLGSSTEEFWRYAVERAYRLNPSRERNACWHAFATTDRVASLMHRGEYRRALSLNRRAIRIFPDDPRYYKTASVIYAEVEDRAKALQMAREALKAAEQLSDADYMQWMAVGRPVCEYRIDLVDALAAEGGDGSLREIGRITQSEDAAVAAHAGQLLRALERDRTDAALPDDKPAR